MVDDFLIHAYRSNNVRLTILWIPALFDWGLYVQRSRPALQLSPEVLWVLYDTSEQPTLRLIPAAVSRARARYLTSARLVIDRYHVWRWRWSLVASSLSAAPQRIGQAYLKAFTMTLFMP
jgi:hypothetical protein